MEQLFVLFAFLLLLSAIMTITSSNPIHSVFWLVLVFVYTAAALVCLGLEFLALILVVIYVGAITILFLFVVMMLDILSLRDADPIGHITPVLGVVVAILSSQLWVYGQRTPVEGGFPLDVGAVQPWTDLQTLSTLLYTEFAFPLLLISLLLLVAMVGAIVLTLELGAITRRQSLSVQHQRIPQTHGV